MAHVKAINGTLCFIALFQIALVTPAKGQNQTSLSSSSLLQPQQKSGVDKSTLDVGQKYFISASKLNLRSSNSITEKNVIGYLVLNDEVELINALNAATPLVQVRVIRSVSFTNRSQIETFVSKDYLSPHPTQEELSKYFIIQNVATEKTRLYERCFESPACPHRMIMETDMVVGRPEEGTEKDEHAFKTWLGHSQISEWIKFYQDEMGHYPHWYKRGQDLNTIPSPLSESGNVLIGSRDWMLKNKKGEKTIYGAFGWYAAKLEPEDEYNGVNYQWIHGTIGWGKDGASAIELTRSTLLNLFSNPGSSGCTRLENRAVAYLRHLVPVGTDVYRVYARESTREKELKKGFLGNKIVPLPRYADKFKNPLTWDFILLTNGSQESGGLTADASTIINRAIEVVTGKNLIEQGSYQVDQYPNAVPLDYNYQASSGKTGDRYQIDSGKEDGKTKFKGYFLVDEGRFIDYEHPSFQETDGIIRVGGLHEFRIRVPEHLKAIGDHHPPEIRYNKDPRDNNP